MKHEISIVCDSVQNIVSWREKKKAAQTKHKTLVLRNGTHKHTKTIPKDKITIKKHKEEDKIMTRENIYAVLQS